MLEETRNLINRLDNKHLLNTKVIPWASPIISFGNPEQSKIATLGLNPSNREFVDLKENEITGSQRRFHTLSSLNIKSWSDVSDQHISLIYESCQNYFSGNPYNGWFKPLDYLLSGTPYSFYFPSGKACHLDIIPYATSLKWSDLTIDERSSLLNLTGDTLGLILRNSSVETLILNGQTVVDNLERVANIRLEKKQNDSWTLFRSSGLDVLGYSYEGIITRLGNTQLNRKLKVLGYNHNIQSSFGVTKGALTGIKNWIAKNY